MNDASPRSRTRTSWLRKAFYGLLVAGIVLAAAEGIARWIHGPPPPPTTVWTMVSQTDTFFAERDGRVHTTYQGSEPAGPCAPFAARTDEPRIALVGASSVRPAFDMPTEGSFAYLLEQRTGVPVVNLGVIGADSHDLVRIVDAALAYSWTAMVVYTGHCDVGNAFLTHRYARVSGWLTATFQPLLERSQLFVQYRMLLAPVSLEAPPGEASEVLGDEEITAIHRAFERNLDEIVELTRRADVTPVLVVPACDLTDAPPRSRDPAASSAYDHWARGMELLDTDPAAAVAALELARDTSPRPVRAFTATEQAVRRVASAHGVTCVDAREELPRDATGALPAPELFGDEIHFNERGHRAMAELLEPVVRSLVR